MLVVASFLAQLQSLTVSFNDHFQLSDDMGAEAFIHMNNSNTSPENEQPPRQGDLCAACRERQKVPKMTTVIERKDTFVTVEPSVARSGSPDRVTATIAFSEPEISDEVLALLADVLDTKGYVGQEETETVLAKYRAA